MKRVWIGFCVALGLAGCETSAPVAEPLRGAALETRLGNQVMTLWLNDAGIAVMTLRAGGTGQLELRPSGETSPLIWKVQGRTLCAADVGERLDCARIAISGNNVTVRWMGGAMAAEKALSGTLSPV